MPIIKTKDHIYMYIVADIADRPLVCSIQLLMILNDACIHCTVYTCWYSTVYIKTIETCIYHYQGA